METDPILRLIARFKNQLSTNYSVTLHRLYL
jgi:hypothetical protein